MGKLTLEDVVAARSLTPVDYYRKDADTLDTEAYRAFVNSSSFQPGAVLAANNVLIQSTKFTKDRKTKRRYQVYLFLDDDQDEKLDHLCLYIPVWAFFKKESFRVLSIDQTAKEGTDTFSIHAVQGSKHIRISSAWLVEKNQCTIRTEWFNLSFYFDPFIGAARFDYAVHVGEVRKVNKDRKKHRLTGSKVTRTQLSFTHRLKTALEKAAAEQDISASLLVNEILENHPLMAKYLEIDET